MVERFVVVFHHLRNIPWYRWTKGTFWKIINLYSQVSNLNSIDDRVRRIKQLIQSSFHRHPDANHLIEHCNLLERLSPVIASDANNSEIQATIKANQTDIPKLCLTSSVLDALFYSNYFHFGAPENLLASPSAFRKVHKLTEKQDVWVATTARACRWVYEFLMSN